MAQGSRVCSSDDCDRPARSLGLCPMHYLRFWKTGSTERKTASEEERFLAKVEHDPSGCWLWTAYHYPTGYGLFKPSGIRCGYAHRWSYEHFVGPIPDGLQIDHLCRVRSCVNPAHLEPVTAAENLRRSSNVIPLNTAKTHCKRGHEFTPENTHLTRSGARSCRTCSREKAREYRQKRAAAR